MTALKPLGDPNAIVCEGDACVLPTTDDTSVATHTD